MDGDVLLFPKAYTNHRRAKIHFSFIIEFAKLAGVEVKLVKNSETVFLIDTIVSCELNNKQIIFDYSDFTFKKVSKEYANIPYFKFQCPIEDKPKNVFPCGPIFVYAPNTKQTLKKYFNIVEKFNYISTDSMILCKQTPKGNALVRRRNVQKVLLKNYNNVDINIEQNKERFWKLHEKCLCGVCVPGACENSLDRGQYELMGLGVCVISPKIPVLLPWDKVLIPNEHYIAAENNFSDLCEKVNWCENNKDECTKIGQNAKSLFKAHFTPTKSWEWIKKCTGDFYENR